MIIILMNLTTNLIYKTAQIQFSNSAQTKIRQISSTNLL